MQGWPNGPALGFWAKLVVMKVLCKLRWKKIRRLLDSFLFLYFVYFSFVFSLFCCFDTSACSCLCLTLPTLLLMFKNHCPRFSCLDRQISAVPSHAAFFSPCTFICHSVSGWEGFQATYWDVENSCQCPAPCPLSDGSQSPNFQSMIPFPVTVVYFKLKRNKQTLYHKMMFISVTWVFAVKVDFFLKCF